MQFLARHPAVKYVDMRVVLPDDLAHPMVEFIREADVVEYEEVIAWNILPGEDLEYELFYVEAEREPYEAQVQSVDSVIDYEIAPVDEDSFHVWVCNETREEDRQWRMAFAALSLVVVPPIAYDSTGGLHMIVVGAGEGIQEMLDTLPGGVDVEVKEIGSYERRRGLAGAMTPRQREAVRTAVDLGYYEVPREAELDEVAAHLDCADSTASELLRRAEAGVLSTLVDRRWPR